MSKLTTSTGLSVTIFKAVDPRKGPLLGFSSVLHHMSLVLSSGLSSSLLSSYSVLVSLSLEKTIAHGHNCLCKLVVGTSLSLSKISLSLSSEASEHVSAHNSHKISSFKTLLCKARIATEGSYKRNQRCS